MRHSRNRLVGLGALFSVVLAMGACASTEAQGENFTIDPTSRLEASTWLVSGVVVKVDDVGFGHSRLTIDVGSVEVLSDTYRHFDLVYVTPSFPTIDGQATVEHYEPETSIDLVGRDVHLLLQAFEPLDMVLAGEGTGVVAIFDEAWVPIEASGYDGTVQALRDLLPAYGQSPDAVKSLIADAQAGRTARDLARAQAAEREAAENAILVWDDDTTADLDDQFPLTATPPTTPGPLGEWRRANGWEVVNDDFVEDDVAAFLATDHTKRQLPITEDEMPPELQDALGLGPWKPVRVVVDRAILPEGAGWVGAYVADLGLLGPFHLDDRMGVGEVSGLIPEGASMALVTWGVSDSPEIGAWQTLIGLAAVGDVPSGSATWVDADGSIEVMSDYDLDMRLVDYAVQGQPSGDGQS